MRTEKGHAPNSPVPLLKGSQCVYTETDMIKIYTSPSCSSCRKVKQWFEEQKIPYVDRNIFAGLTPDEIKEMIVKSENGTDDIISPRSKIVQEQHIDFDSMKISELIQFVRENPSVLRRPIIVDDRKIQVGYNAEEIDAFVPRARRFARFACLSCPQYQDCDGHE